MAVHFGIVNERQLGGQLAHSGIVNGPAGIDWTFSSDGFRNFSFRVPRRVWLYGLAVSNQPPNMARSYVSAIRAEYAKL